MTRSARAHTSSLDELLQYEQPKPASHRQRSSRWLLTSALWAVIGALFVYGLLRIAGIRVPYVLIFAVLLTARLLRRVLRDIGVAPVPGTLRRTPARPQYSSGGWREQDGLALAVTSWQTRLEWLHSRDDPRQFIRTMQPRLVALIDELPREHRQPSLIFSAMHLLDAPVRPWGEVRDWVVAAWPRIAAVARTRRTQTNEAGRCAPLLAALARIAGPVALIELGASAGLCLGVDRYSYRFDDAPLLGLLSLVLPAIAMGNAVVAVPSERAALLMGELYQVFDTSDLPGGVVNLVAGRAAELAKTLAEHDDVDAVWSFRDEALSALVKLGSAGNLKQVWTNAGRVVDWFDPAQAEGRWFLRHATQVKNIWVPYGE